MGLKINATRTMSLNGFANGWDDCFLTVKAVRTKDAEVTFDQIEAFKDSEDASGLTALLESFCTENILSGTVMTTTEDGKQEPYSFSKSETPEVVAELNTAWMLEVLDVSTGNDRLKAKII